MLCATDGHARNFSVFVGRGGQRGITRRLWMETARVNGLEGEIQYILAELMGDAAGVVERVNAELPKDFPVEVSEPILKGLMAATARLEAGN